MEKKDAVVLLNRSQPPAHFVNLTLRRTGPGVALG